LEKLPESLKLSGSCDGSVKIKGMLYGSGELVWWLIEM